MTRRSRRNRRCRLAPRPLNRLVLDNFLLVVAMAALWWVPTFVCLSDLQRRGVANSEMPHDKRIRRVVLWRWTAVLCVPLVGALLYWTKGRRELDGAA